MGTKETKLIIDVIDKSDWLFALTAFFDPGSIPITGVSEMVERIIAKANEEGGTNTIYRLNIMGHGAPGVQSVGGGPHIKQGKYLDTNVLMQYSNILGRLKPYFRADAVVTLYGCEVGSGAEGTLFLKQFSRIIGALVQAGEKVQYPLSPGIDGPIKRCSPISCGSPNQSFQRPIKGGGGSW